jgi:hypothetical protein
LIPSQTRIALVFLPLTTLPPWFAFAAAHNFAQIFVIDELVLFAPSLFLAFATPLLVEVIVFLVAINPSERNPGCGFEY